MKYFVSVAFFIVTFSYQVFGQTENSSSFSIGIESNSQYYINDRVTGDFLFDDRFRSNDYLKAEYNYNHFTFGLQLESYAPQALLNYNPKYENGIHVGLYYGQFIEKKWDVTLGYFYEQFGNGMILRTWEDRQLGINNALRGARVKFKPTENSTITALWGQQRTGFDVSNGTITGADFNLEFPTLFNREDLSGNFGLSFVNRYDENTSKLIFNPNNGVYYTSNFDVNPNTMEFGGRLGLNYQNFYTQLEAVVKSKDIFVQNGQFYDNALFYGNAFQLNLGYTEKGFGINTTFRRLENMPFYSDRAANGNYYLDQYLNYLPALTKQHDYTLTNIYVYQAQPSIYMGELQKAGEIGSQFDMYYQFKKGTALGGKYGTKLSLNYASWFGLKADYINNYNRINVSMLGFDELYFSDLSLEMRKKWSDNLSGIFTLGHGTYNKKYIEDSKGVIYSDVAVAEATVKTGETSSVRVEAQHLWTQQDMKNWAAGTLEYNFNQHFSLFANDMYNYGNDTEKNHYYVVGGSLSLERTRFGMSFGRQRGGVLCVGGVCREVPAATGLSINLTTSF